MSFELRDHTADVAVEARASEQDGVFAAVANGLAAAMCDVIPELGERFTVTVRAESEESLLFDYLDELIYQRDIRDVLPVENEATITGDGNEWTLSGSARGVPLSELSAREVKAVTYSEMALTETEDGWYAYVVFDV